LSLCLAACSPPSANNAAAAKNPESSEEFASLVPQQWRIEHVTRGRLDGDELQDAALTLRQTDTPDPKDARRGLLVLLATGPGQFRRVAWLDQLLPCVSCLGALGGPGEDTPIVVAIDSRQLTVGWLGGAQESVEVSLELGLEASAQRLVLNREQLIRTDRALGKDSRLTLDYVAHTRTQDGHTEPLAGDPVPAETLREETLR